MIDDNWELIEGEPAHAIEVLNYSNQTRVIEALIYLFMHHHEGVDGGCTHCPNQTVLREFHRTGTLFLLHRPGEFREEEVVVSRTDGTVVHRPPTVDKMEGHLDRFFAELTSTWQARSAQEIAAFALWMVNWVHPFKNGNGRTARAFSYACLSLKLGFVLPGAPTVIDQIMEQRGEYQDALKIADKKFESDGSPDLEPMIRFIDWLLARQLSSIGA
jgi:Fic family protein